MSEYEIRRAEPGQKDALIQLLNTAFSNEKVTMDFAKSFPYLFHQDRIPNHIICMDGDAIIGNIGVYPYHLRIGGEIFNAAGIGQVACKAEYRGKGVMSSILKRVCSEMVKDNIDFSWLYGDRLRYGRYGWVKGGRTQKFEMYDKYLPAPPEEDQVRIFNPETDLDLLKKHFNTIFIMQNLTDRDIKELVSRDGYTGYVLQEAFIIVHIPSDTIEFSSGAADQIALLFAHYARELRKRDGDYWKFSVTTGNTKAPVMRVCERSYWQTEAYPSGMFRVSNLIPFLEKVCRVRTGSIPLIPGELSLKNTDTGEEATIVCDEISLTVKEGAENPFELNTRELSEVCFGWCPIDLFLPKLPANSPFRQVFPLHFHFPKFVAV